MTIGFEELEEEALPAEMPPEPDAAPLPPVTVQQMDELLATLFQKRDEAAAVKKELAEQNKEIARLEGQVVAALESFERKNFRGKIGMVSIVEKWRVNVPQGEEAKKRLFEYFKAKGILWSMATVNANALNSFFLQEWDVAKEKGEGLDFELPGIGPAKLHKQLMVKKGS